MCERKSWTKMEDKILKLLYQQRGHKKWSDIAEIMRSEYGILGRNGKQCRQRYHNHLDQKISKTEWTTQEDQALVCLHNRLGNRWALIAREIKGRTDNCVKNRFYSRFRRSIRNVNGLIKIFWKKQFKQLKPTFITKVIEITQQYRASHLQSKKQIFEVCQNLKCKLLKFSDCNEQQLKQNQNMQEELCQLIKSINLFNRKNKRKGKKKKSDYSDFQDEQEFDSQHKSRAKSVIPKVQHSISSKNIKSKLSNKEVEVKKEEIQQTYYRKNIFSVTQKPVLQTIVQNHEVKIENEHTPIEQQKLICDSKILLYGEQKFEKKKLQTQQFLNEKFEDGFDLNQFYHMEDAGYTLPPGFC